MWFQIPMEELSPPSEIIKLLLPTKSTNSRGHIVLILLVDVGFTSWTLKLVDIYTDGCSLKYQKGTSSKLKSLLSKIRTREQLSSFAFQELVPSCFCQFWKSTTNYFDSLCRTCAISWSIVPLIPRIFTFRSSLNFLLFFFFLEYIYIYP